MFAQFPSVHRWRTGIRGGGGGDVASQRGTSRLHAEVLKQELGFFYRVGTS